MLRGQGREEGPWRSGGGGGFFSKFWFFCILVDMEMKVLIVDDSVVARLAVKGALKESGATLLETSSGEAALELVSSGLAPSVVFLDLTMPGLDGLSTLKALRVAVPGIKVVMVTADIQARTVAELREAGASEVLRKPADRAAVLAAYHRAVDGPAR